MGWGGGAGMMTFVVACKHDDVLQWMMRIVTMGGWGGGGGARMMTFVVACKQGYMFFGIYRGIVRSPA